MNSLSILTYNIHKGFSATNRKFILNDIKQSIQDIDADLVCLQEVIGTHSRHFDKIKNWPDTTQFEFLADQVWPHFAYGQNAVYPKGHHGNAILSKFPVISWGNIDISSKFERRGILYTTIKMENDIEVSIFCIHFGLFAKDRKKQLETLIETIIKIVPSHSPLIIAGDFNDWQNFASKLLFKKLNLQEAFYATNGKVATTFPTKMPLLQLDRIYYRNLKCLSAQILKDSLWRKLSDHLPLMARFEL